MTALYCPNCGTETKGKFKFCPNCGTKLPDVDAESRQEIEKTRVDRTGNAGEVLRCPTCGFENHPGARSCESCGTFLGGTEMQKTEKEPAPHQQIEKADAVGEEPRKQAPPKKEKSKSHKPQAQQKPSAEKRFRLETYQVAAIAAAILLGGILIYGLMSSKTTSPDSGGGNMPSQQSTASGTSTGQPSPDVLHEINRLREVVSKEPDDLGSLLRLSNMLQDNGFYDQAAIYYKQYLGKVPKNVDARVDYGVTLFEGGHTQEAISQLNDALKINPNHQIGLYNLGIVYLNAGEFEKANAEFKKCAEVDPNSEIGKKAEQTLKEHANFTSQEVN